LLISVFVVEVKHCGIIGDTTAGITAVWISLGTPPTAAIRPEGLPSGPQEQSYSWASRGYRKGIASMLAPSPAAYPGENV
jgi:hypothetical protein